MADFEVVCEAVRKQAEKWDALAAEARQVHHGAESAELGVTAFLLGDPTGLSQILTIDNPVNAMMLQSAYSDIQTLMVTLLDEAATEFEQIGDALIRVAVDYEEAEAIIELNLNEIFMV